MRVWFSILSVMFFLSLSGCEDNRVVARVGNKPIYVKDFIKEFLVETSVKEGDIISKERKDACLDMMIEKRLRLFAAYQNRCDTMPKVREVLKNGEKRYILDEVIQKKVVEQVIHEKDYQDRYYRVSNQIHAQQIYLPFPFGNREEAKKKIYTKLDSLRLLINKGEDFGALARQFSRDSLTAGKGGDLGFLQWDDKKYNDKFLNFIYDMKAVQGAQIFETERGLHLVQIIKVRPVRVPSYKQIKPELLKAFYTERGTELTKQYNTFAEALEKSLNIKWKEDNVSALIDFIRNELDSVRIRGEEFDAVKINNKIPRNILLLEYNNGKYNSGNFVDDLIAFYPMFFPGIYTSERIKENIKRFADRDMMVQYGYKHNFLQNPKVRENIEKMKQDLMLKNINKMMIDDSLTEEACAKYYELNKQKYAKPKKYKIQEIMVKDSVLAETIYKRISNKEKFEPLVKKYNERAETKNKNGELGYFTESQYGDIGKTAATMQVGEISRPVKSGLTFSVFKLLEIVEPEERAYADLEGRIKKSIKSSLGKERAKIWMDELNKQYPVIKYETILDRIFNEKTI